jgi:hypothetical protein
MILGSGGRGDQRAEISTQEQQQERQHRGGRPGTSHRQAKAAAIATKPPACSSLRAIRSMVAAST